MKTNIELQNDIIQEFQKEPMLSEAEINVDVEKGVVTLSGTVSTKEMKIAAKTVAKRIPGVKIIIDKIDIKPVLPSEEDMTKSTFAQEENIISDTAEKKLKISGA